MLKLCVWVGQHVISQSCMAAVVLLLTWKLVQFQASAGWSVSAGWAGRGAQWPSACAVCVVLDVI